MKITVSKILTFILFLSLLLSRGSLPTIQATANVVGWDVENYLGISPDWLADSYQSEALLGSSVATAGDVNGDGYADVIVGAPRYTNDKNQEGAAFVYHGSPIGLGIAPAWIAEGDQYDAWFGVSVSNAGDVNGDGYSDVIVGAHNYKDSQDYEGAAFVYHGSPSGLSATPGWMVVGGQYSAYLGFSVGTAGDVNGDGYSDVVVGAPGYDNLQDYEGAAFIYHGSASGLSATPDWMVESDEAYAGYGSSVSTAGDVNGDGYSDLVIGAPGYGGIHTDVGRAYVYHGSAMGLSPAPDWTAESDRFGSNYGASVGTAGDMNGDGYSDLVVGAYCYNKNQAGKRSAYISPFYAVVGPACRGWETTNEGRVFVYHGGMGGLDTTPSWTADGDQDDAFFGYSVGTAGDVNSDGYEDLVIGAPRYDHDQSDEGRAYLFLGSEGGLSTIPDWNAESDNIGAQYGWSVATAGDVNSDGYADVIIGAPYCSYDQTQEGCIYIYYGFSTGLNTMPIADAGDDQSVSMSANVTLDGSGSSDPDDHYPLSYRWTQVGGPEVIFTPTLSATTFTAPSELTVLTFALTVTDSFGLVDPTPDEVVIAVDQVNIHLPLILKTKPGINGRVTLYGDPISGVSLELRFYNGADWSTIATTMTDSEGYYAFLGAPSLGPEQKYYVRYLNDADDPGRLWFWGTRELTSYLAGGSVAIGNFDIADIYLSAPADGETVALPYTFQWYPRPTTPSDTYEFNLYDPTDEDPYFYTDSPLGYVDSYTLNSLPPDFSPGIQYAWDIWVYSPDGGFGISYEMRLVTFSNTGMENQTIPTPLALRHSRILENLPDR